MNTKIDLQLWRQHAIQAIKQTQDTNIFTVVLVICIVLFCSLGYMVVQNSIAKETAVFSGYVDDKAQELENKMLINQFVLDGLTAFINDSTALYHKNTQAYAARLMDNYPHIYSMHIIHVTPKEDQKLFVQDAIERNDPQFSLSTSLSAEQNAKQYFPVIFSYPDNKEEWLENGSDIQVVTGLQNALSKILRVKGSTILSEPIMLFDNSLAFAVFNLGSTHQHDKSEKYPNGHHRHIPFILLRAKSLQPIDYLPHYQHQLVFSNRSKFPDSTDKILFNIDAIQPSLESFIFPKLESEKSLFNSHGEYRLVISKQLGWNSINFLWLSLVSLISLLFGAVVIVAKQAYEQREMTRMAADKKLHFLANYDVLTGLPNRNYLQDFAQHAIAFANRHKTGVAFLYLDLDGFKAVNDQYGHHVGDEALVRVAGIIKQRIRQDDICARIGGDEFVIIMHSVTDEKECMTLVENLKQAVSELKIIRGHLVNIGLSIGVSIYPENGVDVEELLCQADKFMYEEKRDNKNTGTPLH